MTPRRVVFATGLALVLWAAACHQDELVSPAVPPYAGGAMFLRYVSMGNSITAGFQSGGINDSTQKEAYPILVAAAMRGTPFRYPSLTSPGCPPPFTNVFTLERLQGGTASTCFFRSPNIPPYLGNVAVPGAEVLDILRNGPGAGTNSNALTQLMLGGRTQVQAMMDGRPTFVSVWIGNNDVLGAATSSTNGGDSALITPVATFQTDYAQVVDSVEAAGAEAILVGVAQVAAIPFFSAGQVYFALKNTPPSPFPATFVVGPNCAPSVLGGKGDSVLVPFPFGAALIGAAQAGASDTLFCTEPQTIQPAELVKLVTTVIAYNTFISNQANTNGWAYLDPNPTLDSLRAIPSQVAQFPALGQPCSVNPFGAAFSCDGVHPSAPTHRLIARKIVQAINAKYASAIPAVP
jgi:lysophospholipase L1-like esterase